MMSTVFSPNGLIGNQELRLKLLDNGYSPVPVNGKNPSPIVGWNVGEITPERIAHDVRVWRSHENTGLLTSFMPTVDIDLWNDDHVADVGIVVAQHLGLSPLLRRGRKGLAMCYRLVGEPIGKLVIREKTGERHPNGKAIYKTLVEILGRGNQVVAYGLHPDTQRPYWWLEPGGEPLLVPLDDLPAVTPDQLRELAAAIRVECGRIGYNVEGVCVHGGETPSDAPQPTGTAKDADDITQKFFDRIPRSRRSPTGYYNFNCPACGDTKRKGGFRMLANGGWDYHCFHARCEFEDTTGWQPGRNVGEREKRLYELLGGDSADLSFEHFLRGYDSITELLAEFWQ